ncbi:putative bifunctional diguanylate cyclase/phosphodiesterase [Pseudomonas luteola]|uniref:putative bifunctional diguanylate cyclase/phosphodiesterase n=1 Tax=Pseudomonas luteola TaxID=47886 RepID=UPI00123BFB5F|nr:MULTISPECIES: EAL domain-containing protein [Pseudomonas]MBA1246544.1 EAL domain-containing protein [Pseudomonas zeshuii]QEU27227.1 EAL domain-containing protein [Pseudomonas luteola]
MTDKYRTAVDAAAIFSETDPDGTITYVNDQFCAVSGYSKEELLGSNHRILNSGQHPQEFYDSIWATITRGEIWKGEICNRRKDGSLYWVNSTIVPITDDETQKVVKYISIRFDVTEHQELLQALQWRASHDVLTGLPNRALLHERLGMAISSARRHHRLLALGMLDLDGFKIINDTYGHAIGDRLLVEVANRLHETLREEDTLARMGGDEFVLILNDIQLQTLPISLRRLLETLSQPYEIDGQSLEIAGSIGVTIYPNDNEDPDTLLRHADQAMYQAKQDGRNRFQIFDVPTNNEARAASLMLARLEQALMRQELRLYYQPKVNLQTGKVIGFEALLRWQSPYEGLVPPLQFLPFVERNDLIVEIGEWVIDQALRQIKQWSLLGHSWPVSVNIAARHFQKPNFVERLRTILDRHPEVSPNLLDIEIVESTAIENMEHVTHCLMACQAMGVTFSLDDFGTGYSSLSYLKRLPAQTIKIDQSFVRDILTDKEDLALSEAIIGLSKAFDREVLAEGVETRSQGKMLLEIGCQLAQGYGIARPMPADQVLKWVEYYSRSPSWEGESQQDSSP